MHEDSTVSQRRQASSLPYEEEFNLANLTVLRPLGRGATGVVFHIRTGEEELALKVVKKILDSDSKLNTADARGGVWYEREVLRGLNHPLLPRLRGVMETEKVVGYAIDYCSGGDLDSLRRQQNDHVFSDEIIRFYAAEMVLGLEYLHSSGIVYRDMKPENVLIQASGHLMLVDFDLSTRLIVVSQQSDPGSPPPTTICNTQPPITPRNNSKRSILPRFLLQGRNTGVTPAADSHPSRKSHNDTLEQELMRNSNSFVGTEEYMAPEMISGKGHNSAVDWWSLGVVLYEMRYGTTPFRGSSRKETFRHVLGKRPEMVGGGEELRDLIGKLLEKDPWKRIGVEEVKGHGFFTGVVWEAVWRIGRPPFVPVMEELGGMEIEEDYFEKVVFDDVEKLVVASTRFK